MAGPGEARPPPDPAVCVARAGTLNARLAASASDLEAVQRLRYRVFHEEMSATPTPAQRALRLDGDEFDRICDHLMVIDEARQASDADRVVGCFRFLRQDVAAAHDGFCTAAEYDIEPLLARHGPQCRFLELGRSCVLASYRTKAVLNLLLQGIGVYVALHRMDVMFGCASFPGTDPGSLAVPLSYLAAFHAAPAHWSARARPERYVAMDMIPPEQINTRAALRALPPILRGYVRAGCYIGDGAVVDHQFGTTDVLIVFPVAQVTDRYFKRFS